MGDTMRSTENPIPIINQATRGVGVSVPDRRTGAPPVDRPKPKKEKDTRKSPHTLRKIILGTASAILVPSAVAAGQHHIENEVPLSPAGITQDILAIPGQVAGWFNSESEVPEVPTSPIFDPNAKNVTIEIGVNTSVVSQEALKTAYENQVSQNMDGPTVIFPVRSTAAGQRTNYAFDPPITGSKNSQTGQPVTLEFPGRLTLQTSRGTEIVVPAENAEVFQFEPKVVIGTKYFKGVFIKWQENGETFGLRIAASDIRTFKPLGDIANAPVVPTRQQGGLDLSEAKNGLKIPLGTSIASVNIGGADIHFNLDEFNPATQKWESKRPNFVTVGPDGQEKIVVLPALN